MVLPEASRLTAVFTVVLVVPTSRDAWATGTSAKVAVVVVFAVPTVWL